MSKKENVVLKHAHFSLPVFLSTPSLLLVETSLPFSFQGDVFILKIEFGEGHVDTKKISLKW